jgi:hypothetical protein
MSGESRIHLLNGKVLLNRCGGNQLVASETPEDPDEKPCCCDNCCLVGDNDRSIMLAGIGGDTCWGVSGNAHIYFTSCERGSKVLKGLGIIGQNNTASIESIVTYDGEPVKIVSNECTTSLAKVRTNSSTSVSISSVGTRNSGSGQGWTHSPGGERGESTCNSSRPGTVGGQGAYTLTVNDIAANGDYIVYLRVGCSTANMFTSAPNGRSGTYFYVAGDNQNIGSTLNGSPALTCGSGSMIESAVKPNLGTSANWNIPSDCIIWLVEGWIVPYDAAYDD